MAKSVRALMRKKLTGDDVGRLMIEDLVASYRLSVYPEEAPQEAPLTEEEKAALVGSLIKPSDLQRYNEYRYVHEALINAQMYALLQVHSSETAYWKLFPVLDNFRSAEVENAFLLEEPRVMTQKEYIAAVDANTVPEQGVAMLMDEREAYEAPGTFLYANFSARPFLDQFGEAVGKNYGTYLRHMGTYFVAETAIGLVGDMIGVPDVRVLVPPINVAQYEGLSGLMREIPTKIVRESKVEEEALRAQIEVFLQPVPIEELRPSAKQIEKVRKQLDFSYARGNLHAIYELLASEEAAK